ncbi:hypothetical protein DFH09DRAFT_1318826 [Mycena vulgaris]|nr:hypothetical protein DFH09DRAFT_1318826 [Mycena vulgaris]
MDDLPPFAATLELPTFIDSLPLHSHQRCEACRETRQCHDGPRMMQCAACFRTTYCSKDCQQSDWPLHKRACRERRALHASLALESGVASALSDIWAWQDFYDTVLWNCVVAAMAPPVGPTQLGATVEGIHIHLHYNGDLMLPVPRRFEVADIERTCASAHPAYASLAARGHLEFGPTFYGVAGYTLTVDFGAVFRHTESILYTVDRTSATAAKDRDWEPLLRVYTSFGRGITVCCSRRGKMNSCRCGGWVHNADPKSQYLSLIVSV